MKLKEFPGIKWEQAMSLRKKGDLLEAEQALKEAVEEQPDHPLLKSSLAAIFIKQKKFLEAKAIAEEILARHPSHPLALFTLGEISFKEKRLEKALEYFEQAAQRDERPYLLVRIARTLSELGNHEDAKKGLDNALLRHQDNLHLLKEKALVLNRMKRHEEALNLYEKLSALLPADKFVRKEVIRLRGLQRPTETTIRELEVAVNMPSQKDDPQLIGLLAQQLKDAGRLEDAANRFEKAWELKPDNPFFLKQAGFCYYRMGIPTKAIQLLSRALRADPGDYYVKYTLEKIYLSAGKLKEYIDLLEDILRQRPHQVKLIGTIKKLRKKLGSEGACDQ